MTRPPGGGTVPGNRWDLAPSRAGLPRVTVVVTHFEQPAELARTLHALARQTHPRELTEIVVSDDGSAHAPTVPPGVRLVRQPDRGFRAAAARNLGAAAGTGEVLVFLDADTTPEPGFVAAATRLPHAVPEAVVVGRRRHADLAGVAAAEPVEVAGPAHDLGEPDWLRIGYARSADLLRADDASYRFVISAVLACSRWLFEETGGFDETFDAYGGEDWEWAQRAWQAGAVLAHEPAAVAWHDGADRAGRTGSGDVAADQGDRAAKLVETLGLARRSGLPGATTTGLAVGPADLAITVAPDLTPTELLVSVDSVLQAFPHAHVLATPEQARLLAPDPRVRPADHPWDRYRLRLDLLRGVWGPETAWRGWEERLRGVGAPGSLTLLDPSPAADVGAPLVRLTLLRAERRAARWGRDDLFASVTRPAGELRAVGPRVTLEAVLGGWAR